MALAAAIEIAAAIRAKIKSETDLPASAGVNYNKFIAVLITPAVDYRFFLIDKARGAVRSMSKRSGGT
jgi:impB/mucB/samB family.